MGRTGTRKDVERIPLDVPERRTGTGIGIRVARIETRIEMGTTRAVKTVIAIGTGIVIETVPAIETETVTVTATVTVTETETETETETATVTATAVGLMIRDEIVVIREIVDVRTETTMTNVTRVTRVVAAIGAGNVRMQGARLNMRYSQTAALRVG